jgi:hypothetical protein
MVDYMEKWHIQGLLFKETYMFKTLIMMWKISSIKEYVKKNNEIFFFGVIIIISKWLIMKIYVLCFKFLTF